jgi:hypothetical protein
MNPASQIALLTALNVLRTVPRDEENSVPHRADILEAARKAGFEGADEKVKRGLFDLLHYADNPAIKKETISLLAAELQATTNAEDSEQILREFVRAATATAPAYQSRIREAIVDFARKAPDKWFGGLSQVFAETALPKSGEIPGTSFREKINEAVWPATGPEMLEKVWPLYNP